jgi:hypothetical protein
MTRPLLVTDPGLAGLPIVAQVREVLAGAGMGDAIFSDIHANPLERDVTAGVAAYHSGDFDGVVAMGGGSALDAGKAIALMVGQDRPIWDFEDEGDNWTRVNEAGMAPLVAIPTTSGTGSEVGRCSVIIDERLQKKRLIFHPGMMPARVIADPALTVGLPANLTAWVGMDALSHNLEAYLTMVYHPMADGIALEGMRLVHRWLTTAVREPGNIKARSAMMIASTMGATAFQKGLGAMHALSHPLTVHYGTHHGLTNAVVMPYVMERNRPVIEEKTELLARFLGLSSFSFDAVQDWILTLRSEIGIPHTMSELGVPPEAAEQLAPEAAVDVSAACNPIELGHDDWLQLYHRVIEG